ncbi:ChrR family anti-sigma-E factor [Dongia rigui]|uniref:ChrR family anti-sigma-E factor n=1 Tax=Dongia rigui TaxID=940149 RepID=A0ABU5E1C1_9PROT|nr:ChrR family anti-sigma-E factor [Dongia rigui]MDY0873355.1 ChrR family anti-sigma-E factor [Dongia rigui]
MNTLARRRSHRYPDYHPGDELIAAYASGALDEASALAVASHLTLCPACRSHVALFESVGGDLIEELPEASMGQGAFAATLARAKLMSGPVKNDAAPLAAGAQPILPAPVRQYVGGDLDSAKWRAIGPGIDHMPLLRSGSTTARLLRIAPGRSVFGHTHGGTELTLVLKGSYASQGQHYARGDIEVADESVNHRPIAGKEDICICLAVTDAPLRFGNWIGRLMQPFIGI